MACYAAVLARYVDACAGGSDSSGYLNNARLLASGRVKAQVRDLRALPAARVPGYLYMPLGFKPAPTGGGIVPTYATGLPLLVVMAASCLGWKHACDAVMVAHALAGVWLTFALGRAMRLPFRWAILGALILAVSPLYVDYSLQAMSDLPALVWVTGAVLAAWKSRETGLESLPQWRRPSDAYAFAAGFALAFAILVRPNNLLALAPVAIALGVSPRRWAGLALGGLPGAIFLGVYNLAAYGHLLTTGYGDAWSSFSVGLIPGTFLHYARWLPLFFTPVILLALALPGLRRSASREAAVLGVWALAYLGFYSAYHNTHETWWYLRFVLPAAPPLVVGGLLAAFRFFSRGGARSAREAASTPHFNWRFTIALALVLANGAWWNHKLQTLKVGHGEANYPLVATWLRQHIPADSVLSAMQVTGALFYYTDFTFVRWDQLNPEGFARVAAAARAEQRPIYAVLYRFEAAEALEKRMPGRWRVVGQVREIMIWRYE